MRKFPVMYWNTKTAGFCSWSWAWGRMTPMFIQEPFWNLTLSFPHARYIAVNDKYDFLPKQLEDKGMAIVADIGNVLRDTRNAMENGDSKIGRSE